MTGAAWSGCVLEAAVGSEVAKDPAGGGRDQRLRDRGGGRRSSGPVLAPSAGAMKGHASVSS